MQSEYKHKDRTTKRNILNDGDPIAQFKEKMNAVLLSEDELKKTINLEYLENYIDNIHYSNPEKSIYLNAVAFILGFYILKNKTINKKKYESLDDFKYLMEDNFIHKADVIRYARYFIMNNEFIIKNNIAVNENVNKFMDDEINESVNVEDKKMVNEEEDEYVYEDENIGDYDDDDDNMEGVVEESKDYEPDSLKKFK